MLRGDPDVPKTDHCIDSHILKLLAYHLDNNNHDNATADTDLHQ